MAPRFEKDDAVVETSNPREITQLRAEGFTEHKARTKEVRASDAAAAAPSADQAAQDAAAPAKPGK
ncbi:hypothetical protein [Pseudarthrobacter polychromogenes]|uniref:Uncharacterized protein n=1 Tax=Pseudarthrobacter polychromogenes TaxID=1676 RepID=A0ABQ1Y2M4_9MICC|nr:hypothetical protein [Pseudarthrobacter polychromogenes]GGH10443.1 hypothetical protein GCM10011577_39260 [Pseudarthrobacter polychromogenes]